MSTEDIIPGGKADGRPDSDFDPIQLEKGIAVELEHTNDMDLAKEIAKDHLTEFPDYYDRLAKMEKDAEEGTVVVSLSDEEKVIEQAHTDFEVAYENFCTAMDILENIKQCNGVSKRIALSFENAFPGNLPEMYPLESFTLAESSTNLQPTMEAVTITKEHAKAGLAVMVAGLLLKVIYWIYKKIKGVGGDAEASSPAAKSSAEGAEKATAALKDIRDLGTDVPVPSTTESGEVSPLSTSEAKKVIDAAMEGQLTKESIKGLNGKQIADIVQQRHIKRIEEKFKDRYTRLMDTILDNPETWMKLLFDMSGEIRRRTELHSQKMSVLDVMTEKATDKGTPEPGQIGRSDAAVMLGNKPGQIGPSTVSIKHEIPDRMYRLVGAHDAQVASDDAGKLEAAKNMLSSTHFISKLNPEEMDYEKLIKFAKTVEPEKLKSAAVADELKSLMDKLGNRDVESPSNVAGVLEDTHLRAIASALKADVRNTQHMASFYIVVMTHIGSLLQMSISVNGPYLQDTIAMVKQCGSTKFLKPTDAAKMKDMLADMDSTLGGLKNLVEKWRTDVKKNHEEMAAEQTKMDKLVE